MKKTIALLCFLSFSCFFVGQGFLITKAQAKQKNITKDLDQKIRVWNRDVKRLYSRIGKVLKQNGRRNDTERKLLDITLDVFKFKDEVFKYFFKNKDNLSAYNLKRIQNIRSSIMSFKGHDCLTLLCSGHQAGYEWAENNMIDDEYNCPDDKSESFKEGCESYVEERN